MTKSNILTNQRCFSSQLKVHAFKIYVQPNLNICPLFVFCTKEVLIGHQIWCFYALVLMLLTEFVPNIIFRRFISGIFFNYYAKLAPNIMQICPKQYRIALTAPLQKIGANKVPQRFSWGENFSIFNSLILQHLNA